MQNFINSLFLNSITRIHLHMNNFGIIQKQILVLVQNILTLIFVEIFDTQKSLNWKNVKKMLGRGVSLF